MVRKSKRLSKRKHNKLRKHKSIYKKTCGKKQKIFKTKTKTIKRKTHKKIYYGGSNLNKNYPGSAGNYVMMMVGDGQTQKELSFNSAFN